MCTNQFIRINEKETNKNGILEKDLTNCAGKQCELFYKIACALEEGETLDNIFSLKTELNELISTYPYYEHIPDMIDWLNEISENAEKIAKFEAIRAEILENTGDENLADDVAWNLVYNQ